MGAPTQTRALQCLPPCPDAGARAPARDRAARGEGLLVEGGAPGDVAHGWLPGSRGTWRGRDRAGRPSARGHTVGGEPFGSSKKPCYGHRHLARKPADQHLRSARDAPRPPHSEPLTRTLGSAESCLEYPFTQPSSCHEKRWTKRASIYLIINTSQTQSYFKPSDLHLNGD